MTDQPKGMTIAELAASGRRLVLQCPDCDHRRLVDPAKINVAPETPVSDIGKRGRCGACSRLGVLSYPESTRNARQGRER